MAYQPDRFDEVPEYTDQRGAHRESFAAPATAPAARGARRLSPLLLVAGLVLLAGLFVGVVLPWLTGDRSEPVAAETTSAAPSTEQSATSASPSTEQSATSASPSSEQPATSASPSSEQPATSASPSEDAAAAAASSQAAAQAAAAAAEASRSEAAAAQAAESSRAAAAAQAAESSRAAAAAAQAAESSRAAAAAQAAESSRAAAAAQAAESSRAAAASQAAESSQSAAASRAAAAVRGTNVTVYNATRSTGLAATYARRLTSAGYTSVSAKNWGGYGIQSSTVLYNGASNKAAAEAVAAELGFPVLQTPNLQVNGVAVVVTG